MRITILMLLAVLVLTPACCSPLVNLGIVDAPHVTTSMMVWKLDCEFCTGSGIPIYCGWVPGLEKYEIVFLTAKHVIFSGGTFEATHFRSRTLTKGLRLAGFAGDRDLGLVIFFDPEPVECVSYTTSHPWIGQTVYGAGWPLGRQLHLTQGLMGSVKNSCSISVFPGDSGGAVMDRHGNVFGVITGTAGTMEFGPISHITYFEPLDEEAVKWFEEIIGQLVSCR